MSYKSEQAYLLCWAKKIMAFNKLGGKCLECGNDDIRVLDIHHEESDKKEFGFNTARGKRWSELELELSKCDLLCSNHHVELHYSKDQVWKKNLLEMVHADRCSKCGYISDNVVSLDFHHTEEKFLRIADGYKGDRLLVPVETLISEINKCVVLCRNCHRLEHLDKDRLLKMMPRILSKVKEYREVQIPMDKAEVLRMNMAGIGVCEIARRTGYCKSTVSMILKKLKEKDV